MPKGKLQRAAIYTRKSTDAGLEQDFNSLDAQREACAAYIKSQAHEGWRLLPELYDDGGLSGASLERPALKRLLRDIEADSIDIIVVYKVDRLTRSLTDFSKLVELFDKHAVSFVSVTQQFNTTSSMGRLTLNVLLSFAQFEREVIGERIRDKVAQSKAKGIWMGGPVPLGYDLGDRELLVNPEEAAQVREIYELYLESGSVRALQSALARRGITSKVRHQKNGRTTGGKPLSRGHIYRLLANPIYLGKLPHKGKLYDGKHESIIEPDLWEKVQDRLKSNTQGYRRAVAQHPSLLAGILCTGDGRKLVPSHAVKKGRRYRYYIEQRPGQAEAVGRKERYAALEVETAMITRYRIEQRPGQAEAVGRRERYAALEVETAVITVLKRFLEDPIQVMAALSLESASPAVVRRLCDKAKGLSQRLSDSKETLRLIPEVLAAVIIHPSKLELIVNGTALANYLDVRIAEAQLTFTITSPIRLNRRGQELKFVLPLKDASENYCNPDPGLIRAVAKAHLWWQWITDGEVQSLREIAERENLDTPMVTRLIRLAFLSPKLISQIIEGMQPPSLTVKTLTREIDLPLVWDAQEEVLAAHA